MDADELRSLVAAVPAARTHLHCTSGGREQLRLGAEVFTSNAATELPELEAVPPSARARILDALGPGAVSIGARYTAAVRFVATASAEDVDHATLRAEREKIFNSDDVDVYWSPPHVKDDGDLAALLDHLGGLALADVMDDLPHGIEVRQRVHEIAAAHAAAGMRNEFTLGHIRAQREVASLLGRLDDTAFEKTILGRQDGLRKLVAHESGGLLGTVLSAVPELDKRPATEVKDLVDALVLDVTFVGARLARALLGPVDAVESLSGDELIDAAVAVAGASELSAGAMRALRSPAFVPCIQIVASSMHAQLGEAIPGLLGIDGVDDVVAQRVFFGAVLEAALVRLVAEEREGRAFVADVLAKQGNPVEQMLKAGQVPVPPDAHPWPVDGVCLCGLSLEQFLFCCDGRQPIALAEANAMPQGAAMERSCCGETFHGFRCDACGRLYTWHLGAAASLGVQAPSGGK